MEGRCDFYTLSRTEDRGLAVKVNEEPAWVAYIVMGGSGFGVKHSIVSRAGRLVSLSIVLMTGLSLLSQLLLPAYGMYMPLMGNGSCAAFILCVYFLLLPIL